MTRGIMPNETDYVYENAPLIEVIAEVRWRMISIASMPGAELDPTFDMGHKKIADLLGEDGFNFRERLVPENVPHEFLAGQPVIRFRKGPNLWPLFQMGPGLFTSNIVPPYGGWEKFRPVLAMGLKRLGEAIPFGSQFVAPSQIELRYIDAFTEKHSLTNMMKFISESLQTKIELPEAIMRSFDIKGEDYRVSVDVRMPVSGDHRKIFGFKVSPGLKGQSPAVILNLSLIYQLKVNETLSISEIVDWMDEAHSLLHIAFESTISDQLREAIGPKRQVGN